jgi:hypothetical protein
MDASLIGSAMAIMPGERSGYLWIQLIALMPIFVSIPSPSGISQHLYGILTGEKIVSMLWMTMEMNG